MMCMKSMLRYIFAVQHFIIVPCIISSTLSSCAGVSSGTAVYETVSPTSLQATSAAELTSTGVRTEQLTATPTPTPTLTPFPTSTPVIGTPIVPTPGLPLASENYFPLGDFFFAGQSADCQFPCWNGLRPGESTPEETQQVLKSLLGSPPTVMLSNDDSLLIMAYEWHDVRYSEGSLFAMGTYLWTSDYRLAAIGFRWNLFYIPGYTVDMSPQRLLQEMGPPAKLLVSIEELIGGQDAVINLLILYSNGISYRYMRHSTIERRGRVVRVCLRAPAEPDQPAADNLFVINPLEDVTNSQSSFREILLGENLNPAEMENFESVFGATPEQVAGMAGQEAPLCFYSK